MSFTSNLVANISFIALIFLSLFPATMMIIQVYSDKENFSFWGSVDARVTVGLFKTHFLKSGIQSSIPASWRLQDTEQDDTKKLLNNLHSLYTSYKGQYDKRWPFQYMPYTLWCKL